MVNRWRSRRARVGAPGPTRVSYARRRDGPLRGSEIGPTSDAMGKAFESSALRSRPGPLALPRVREAVAPTIRRARLAWQIFAQTVGTTDLAANPPPVPYG